MSDFQKRLDIANAEVEKRKIEQAKAEQNVETLEKDLQAIESELKELGIVDLDISIKEKEIDLDSILAQIETELK